MTPIEVANRLEEAFSDTLKRLPPGEKPGGYKTPWPDVVQSVHEAYGYNPANVPPGPPSAAAITRLDECLDWLWKIDERNRQLVVARAMGIKWHKLERRFKRKRVTLKRWWTAAMITIARAA